MYSSTKHDSSRRWREAPRAVAPLRRRTPTRDAISTQREIARHLVEDKHADSVLVAKDNQPTLRKDIADLFAVQEQDAKRRQQASKNKKPLEAEGYSSPSAQDRR